MPAGASIGSTPSKKAAKLALWVGFACALVPGLARARLNLPQTRHVLTLSEEATKAASGFFSAPGATSDLPKSLQELLLNSLPRSFRGACNEIVESWGETAKGTAEWRVRLLSVQSGVAWLAFRCGSRQPDLEQYYDERLAALRISPAMLAFLPFGPDLENDSSLYRVEFAESLSAEAGDAVVFHVTSNTDNPCCGGPTQILEQRLMVYVDSPQGIVEALSLLTRREQYDHDDVEGDTETIYRAEVCFERDAQGRAVGALTTFRQEVNGRLERHGQLGHRRNPKTFRFDQTQ